MLKKMNNAKNVKLLIFIMMSLYLVGSSCPTGKWECPQYDCATWKPGWDCKYLKCISTEHVCDGETTCKDKSDEDTKMCAQWNCSENRWKCKDGLQCINKDSVCDGKDHCHDKSDENNEMCAQWNCTTDEDNENGSHVFLT